MTDEESRGENQKIDDVSKGVQRRFLQIGVSLLVQAATLFISSGQLGWTMAWIFIGLNVVLMAINALIFLPNPRLRKLAAERSRITFAKSWDKAIGISLLVTTEVTLIICGLDERFGWSPRMSLTTRLVALGVYTLGYALFTWAMVSNIFFSGIVRIQDDRGHTVATAGPYRYVRHPGYVGYITMSLATPLSLGSLWALLSAGLTACAMVVRTMFEDRTLQDDLEGYKEYAQQVRYRLLPWIW
jgi:protein-S-isoprenylcysteine O-methyltransferase Ste14